jgi:hypothetical protein
MAVYSHVMFHRSLGKPWIHDFQVNQTHQETYLKTVAQDPQDMQLPSLYRSMMDQACMSLFNAPVATCSSSGVCVDQPQTHRGGGCLGLSVGHSHPDASVSSLLHGQDSVT